MSPLAPAPLFQPASRLVPRTFDWLWPNRLALGKLALLKGDPGRGKSLVALDLCARLSVGKPFPEAPAVLPPTNSVVLNGEDTADDTIRPRLQALGADLDRVFVLGNEAADDQPLCLPTHVEVLEQALAHAAARLLVIDPITAFLDPKIMAANDPSVRRALRPLARLADRYHCTILLVLHLNKTGRTRSLYRGSGSIAFVAACRSAWLIAPNPKDPTQTVLAQVKNNLAPPQPSLAFHLAPSPAPPLSPSLCPSFSPSLLPSFSPSLLPSASPSPCPPVPPSPLTWLGPTDWTADDLLSPPAAAPPEGRTDRAAAFLTEALADGPRTSRDIWALASAHGIAERTLNRAKRTLNVRSARIYVAGRPVSYWLLPTQKLPADAAADPDPCDLDPWLDPLRRQYPPSTPIDDW